MRSFRTYLAIVLLPTHLRRTGFIALIVGAWLTAFNEGGQLLAGALNSALGFKIALNILTPFFVANLGLLSRRPPAADVGGNKKTGG